MDNILNKNDLIPALEDSARLKRKLRKHIRELGFQRNEQGMLRPKNTDKSTLRSIHSHQRNMRLRDNRDFIQANLIALERVLANGDDIDPSRIEFELQKIKAGTEEARLFRLASLYWSVPVSNGFGRRIRYLVWDKYHGRLAGLIALGDPVFNLRVRDQLIGWNAQDRADNLVNVLDAYVLGALPPYSQILGGKAVACLVRTREVYNDFHEKYGSLPGIISGKNKRARLLLVTTSSSLGRSSVYNRLKLNNQPYFTSIGFTEGWGHFHVSDELFSDLRKYLELLKHPYVHQNRFGQGPNWRLRTIREGLKSLGISQATLRHGIKREVFLCQMANNSLDILKSGGGKPELSNLLSVSEVAESAIERWILPRVQRRPEFRAGRNKN